MAKTKNSFAIIMIFGFVVTTILYIRFLNSTYFDTVFTWAQGNELTFWLLLLTIKTIGIVYPPLPGGIITLGAIPIIGWSGAYFADFAGSMLGATIAYFLGKRYGLKLLRKIFDDSTLAKLKKIKIKPHREIESVFVSRVVFGSTLLEIICYAAGLLKVRYRNFIIGSIMSHVLFGLPAFYLGGSIIEARNTIYSVIVVLILFPLLWKFKGRYLE